MKISVLLLLLCACAAPYRPTPMDMDRLDKGFRGPTEHERAEKLLQQKELSLEDVLRLADLLNPTLEILRRDVDLAPLAAWDASLFPNPKLEFEVEDFPTSDGRSLGNAERGFGISQTIPVGGRLGAAYSVAGKQRDLAAMRYLWQRRVILTDVKAAFLSVLVARENLQLSRQTRDLAKEFHDLAEERFKAQAVPEMELLKAAVNLATAESNLRVSDKNLVVAIKRLHALLGDVDFPVDRFSGDLFVRFEAPSLEALKGQVIVTHPQVVVAARQKELAVLEVGLAYSEVIPDVDLDLAYKWTPDRERVLEFGVSVPLPIFNRNQARILGAKIRLRQADLHIQAARNAAVLSLIETYRNFAAAQDRVKTYRKTILPKARKALKQTNVGYKAGKFSYLDVLDSQQTLAEARIAYLAALQDLNLFAIQLEKVTGSRLQGIR